MASAWPQIERCKIRQWKSLSQHERLESEEFWNSHSHPPHYGVISQREIALWDNSIIVLMSIKEDRLEEPI